MTFFFFLLKFWHSLILLFDGALALLGVALFALCSCRKPLRNRLWQWNVKRRGILTQHQRPNLTLLVIIQS